MQKNIAFEKGILIIGYWDNSQDISVYEAGGYTEPIRLRFVPTIEMTEQKCLEYANENRSEIIHEAKTVIAENDEFYKNFEIDFDSEFLGWTLHRHHLNRDLLIVDTCWMPVECKLKEKEVILNS